MATALASASSQFFKELLKYRDLEDTFQTLEDSGRLARLESTFTSIYEETTADSRELKDNLKVIVGIMSKDYAVDEIWLRKDNDKLASSRPLSERLAVSRPLSSSLSTKDLKRSTGSLKQPQHLRQTTESVRQSQDLKQSTESLRQSQESRLKNEQKAGYSIPLRSELRASELRSSELKNEYNSVKTDQVTDYVVSPTQSDFTTNRGYTFGGEKRLRTTRTDSPGPGAYNPIDLARQRPQAPLMAKSPRRLEDFMKHDDSSPGPASYYPKMSRVTR
jgi:hypothetical protein